MIIPKVEEDTANFIPQVGKTYSYRQELEEGENIVFTRSISGSKDSTGFKVYNLRTRMVYDSIEIEVNNGVCQRKQNCTGTASARTMGVFIETTRTFV